jgi:hypothetical protein
MSKANGQGEAMEAELFKKKPGCFSWSWSGNKNSTA